MKGTNWQVADVSNIKHTFVYQTNEGHTDIYVIKVSRAYFQMPYKYAGGDFMSPKIAAGFTAEILNNAFHDTEMYYRQNNGNVMTSQIQKNLYDSIQRGMKMLGGRFSTTPPFGYRGKSTPYNETIFPF